MLDDRPSRVLKALVEEYIRTGEPVSSQAVLARSNLDVSSATIRNDLAKLESYGFVDQPHTSAGRIPTHAGYRFYVDNLAPAKLKGGTREKIDAFFLDVHRQISELLRDTSVFVSDLTAYPAVVVGPTRTEDRVREVRLIHLGGSVVLAVAVCDNGRIHQEFVDVGTIPDHDALADAERVVGSAFHGHSLAADLGDRLSAAELPDVVRRVVDPVASGLAAAPASPREVYVGGTAQMASLWNDLSMVQQLLALIDEQADLVNLVNADDETTHVRFGPDLGEADDLAVVTGAYELPSGGRGRIGVIGPLRMNYSRTIRVIERVSENMGERGQKE
ncbi:MAG: heat-inducible transcription repressor HrcA [Acidimicrobiia bacterium]|nr:heat-inducible transcription repressor HrcA [Acidimicrobiia bacterium]